MQHDFDVIVIGAGPAGEVAAGRLATHGKRVAVVERELVGGECSFYACMPSKALLRPAEVLAEARRVPGVAEAVTGALDVSSVLTRRDEVIHDLDDSAQLPWLQEREIALFRGSARLDGERRVVVGDDLLTATDAVILATGSGAAMPPIPGLEEAGAWSNREITTAKEVPKRLTILGGGVVGVEMAQAWSSLGSQVTIIEATEALLANEEPLAGEQIARSLQELGAEVKLGAKATNVRRGDGEIVVTLEDGTSVAGNHLLVAVGRRPQTDQLGLDSVGLKDGDWVAVDDHLQVPGLLWLYAIGDVNHRSLLTHAGKYQGRIAVDHILGNHNARAFADGPISPRVVFTDPEVAAVGMTLRAARDAGIPVLAIDLDTEGSAGGSFVGKGSPGTSRFVVDTEREVLVGVTFIGAAVAEWLQAATIAVTAEVPLSRLAHAIAPFPTRAELWLFFLEEYERRLGLSLHR